MVGQPKSLSDLSRLDANPVVECRSCDWTIEFDRNALIHTRIVEGRKLDWQVFRAEMRCGGCGDRDVRISIRPFVSDRALGRGDTREALVFKALCVLAEAQAAAKRGRVPASFGLRFALAYLYAVGDRRREWFDREPYHQFWQLATQADETSQGVNGDVAGSARSTAMQSDVNGIARAAGMEMTPEVMGRLSDAVHRARSEDRLPDAAADRAHGE